MKSRTAIRNASLAAALAAIAATAWAANESLAESTWVPSPYVSTRPLETRQPLQTQQPQTVIIEEHETVVSDPLPSNERVMPIEAAAVPAVERPQPRITIEAPRLTLDERIQADVIDVIAQAPNLSGKIGVESRDAVVTLSGYTLTAGQASRAARYAASIRGVRYVQNDIRARIGGSV